MSTYIKALSLQKTLSQVSTSDPFKFYEQLKYIHKSVQDLPLDSYKSYFFRTKLLGSDENPIYTIVNLDMSLILSTYTCPDRARLYANADSSYTYHIFKDHSHIFYKGTDTHIYYGEVEPDKGLSTHKDKRGGNYWHKDIANLVWSEDNL